MKTGFRKFWHSKKISLKDKYRLGVYNDTTYEQVFHFRLTGRGVLTVSAILMVVLIALTTVLIAFTPLRELIPGYPGSETRRSIQANVHKADSLEKVVLTWSRYIDNALKIIEGDNPSIVQILPDSSFKNIRFKDTRSKDDSLLRAEIEQDEQFDLAVNDKELKYSGLSGLYFFPPVKGEITSKFEPKYNHLGIDIATGPDQVVSATLDGTVIMADWTIETGNVIQIQHDDNLISVYKHNAKLLQKQGNRIKAGDAIAIVGNSGELTSGPHLHFELWYKGASLNPEQYILF